MMRTDSVKPVAATMLSLLLLAAHGGGVAAVDRVEAQRALDYLNQQRQLAGMTPLGSDSRLDEAAQSHASYLALNSLTGHYQTAGTSGFTGVEASDRVVVAGYPSQMVTENVSYGQDDGSDSIDGLMSAIYHRIGFLDFTIDQIGVGVVTGEASGNHFVYNMGNEAVAALCQQAPSAVTSGSFFTGVCAGEQRIASAPYQEAKQQVTGRNPRWVVWPADGAVDVPPAFYEESPDPLPDYGVSGYPLSLHLNPGEEGALTIESLRLVRAADGASPGEIRVMNQESDPNNHFTRNDLALFPLQRLEWGTAYRAEAVLQVNGERRYYGWGFTTRSTGRTTYTLDQDGERFEVASGSDFAVYLPPRSGDDAVSSTRWSMMGGIELAVDFIDHNTLSVAISGPVGSSATIQAGDRSFSVAIVDGEALAASTPPTGGEGCPGGVELARYDDASGQLELPLVEVGSGSLYRVTLAHQGSMRFGVVDATPTDGSPLCRSASYQPQSAMLDIPHLKLLAADSASSFRAELKGGSSGGGLVFDLVSAAPLP